MIRKLITPPAIEPVTLIECKVFMRLETEPDDDDHVNSDDEYITSLIKSAREYCEEETGRAMINQTWAIRLDGWPVTSASGDGWWDGVKLGSILQETPRALPIDHIPLSSIDHVKTFHDIDGEQVMPETDYHVDTFNSPGKIKLKSGKSWPVVNEEGIEIQYVVGYGSTTDKVPFPLKQAVMQLVLHWYENREAVRTTGSEGTSKVPIHIESILRKYRKLRLA